jgi:Domain of unknown function (DUF222)
MPEGPVSSPGRDEDPAWDDGGSDNPLWDRSGHWRLVPQQPEWDDQQWAAYAAALYDEEEPDDPDLYQDPDNAPPAGLDDAELAALIAQAPEVTADQGVAACWRGRRGPGMPGSARRRPGEYAGPAAGFAAGRELDTAPGCAVLALFAEDAAGDDDRYAAASEDELVGIICAWDRAEAAMAARKHAAAAEWIRRHPEPGCVPEGPGQMPRTWEEFAPAELAPALGRSRAAAEGMLDLALDLAAKLPGSMAAFRSGIISRDKAEIIARATAVLDPAEARAAEALVLDRAGRLTPGGLRAAIARAVMGVAPGKATKRREQAARLARVERWAEDSGNAALAGRELPAAQVLAADQRVTWWAKQLKLAGLAGDMDQLRARAYLDVLLGIDSRPAGTSPDGRADERTGPRAGPPDPESSPAGPQDPGTCAPAGPLAGVVPPGFAGNANLTVPLTTLLHLADRPGDLGGTGPIDPGLARDLAAAAARNPRSTWCVTVTDQHGHAIGHGCARPAPRNAARPGTARNKPGSPGGHDPPRTGDAGRPGFSFTAADQHGPPGGYGTWRLATGAPGQRDLIVAIGPVATGSCDHRHQARGHDPGATLRHLTQIRHATCTGPSCRRPAVQCDFEHSTPYEAGGRTCECNGGPKCRYHHRLKQDPRWTAGQPAPGIIVWTSPAGRRYTTEPTRYPI